MKPPSAEATREALIDFPVWDLKPKENDMGQRDDWNERRAIERAAARAWSRIAPDADGEWSDEVVEAGWCFRHNREMWHLAYCEGHNFMVSDPDDQCEREDVIVMRAELR